MTKDTVVLAKPPKTLKLDLACGQTPREGFEGVDLWEGAKHRQDLLKFPWPWEDVSVDELHCSHFIEHIPMATTPAGKDLLFAFFDECYRILKPGGRMTVLCPNARSNRAFQDPTHRRFIVAETFLYLHKPWRAANKLDHYAVDCDFQVQVDPLVPQEFTLLHPEAAMRRFNESWNVIMDWQAVLVKAAAAATAPK
jgi:SAM-dependent methyltransferase